MRVAIYACKTPTQGTLEPRKGRVSELARGYKLKAPRYERQALVS